MFKNTASQSIGAQMITASDGSAFTGSVTVAVTGDSGTQATGSVGSGACTHEGNGYHSYRPAQAETNYDHIAFTFTGSGAIPVTVQVFTRAGDAFTRLGAPVGASISADIAAVKTQTGAVETDTQDIQARIPAALVGGRIDATVDGTGMEAGAVSAIQSGLATSAELAKVPKSDSNVSWNATALAAIQQQAEDALVAHDAPTNTDLDARTLAAASYATASAQATAQADLDTLTGTDGVILATSQPNYAPATAAALTTVDGIVDTIVATTNKLDDTLEDQGGGTYGFTEASLAEAPSGGGGGPSAADIADAVWEEALGDHSSTSGSTAEALAAAGGAGDPWITPLPGSYSAGQAGYILGTNLNATVSSRATQTSVDDVPTNSELAAALDPLPTAAEIRAEIDSNSTQLAKLGTPAGASVSADIAAVKAQTAAIEADTQDLQAQVGTDGAGLTAIPWNAAWDAEVQSECADALAAYDPPTNAEMEARTIAAANYATAAELAKVPKSDGTASWNATALAAINAQADQALADYDPPTRAELTSDTNSVLSAVGDVPTAAENADAVLDEVVEGAVTLRQSIRLHNAALGGKASGLETTEAKYRDLADTKDRITATVDSDGNRTAVSRDLT